MKALLGPDAGRCPGASKRRLKTGGPIMTCIWDRPIVRRLKVTTSVTEAGEVYRVPSAKTSPGTEIRTETGLSTNLGWTQHVAQVPHGGSQSVARGSAVGHTWDSRLLSAPNML